MMVEEKHSEQDPEQRIEQSQHKTSLLHGIRPIDLSRTFLISELIKVYGSALGIALIIALGAALLFGHSLSRVFLITLFAGIPLGLITTVTLIFKRMKQRVLSPETGIRSVKSLIPFAGIDMVCIEDTWIRLEQLRATKVWCDGSFIEIEEGKKHKPYDSLGLRQLFKIALLCHTDTGEDAAERKVAPQFGFLETSLEAQHPKGEQLSLPHPLSASVRRVGTSSYILVKGPADFVLGRCNRIFMGGEVKPLIRKQYDSLLNTIHTLRTKGFTVQGYCYKELSKGRDEHGDRDHSPETSLIFAGFMAFGGLSRHGAGSFIKEFDRIGVHPLVFTELPDHRARALAGDLGFSGYLSREKVASLSEDELLQLLRSVRLIQAGVSERQKIVHALANAGKRLGFVGAVFGDSVQESKEGTESTVMSEDEQKKVSGKAAAVVSRSSLATVLTLIAAGRTLCVHLQKIVTYTTTYHFAALLFVLIMLLIGQGLSLTVLQLLVLTVVVQVMVGISYATEPSEEHVLEYTFRQPRLLFSRRMLRHIAVLGTVMTLVTLGISLWYRNAAPLTLAGVIFATLFFLELFHALNARSARISFFKQGIFTNLWLLGALGVSLAVLLVLIYTPLSTIFGITALNAFDLGITFIAGSIVFIVREGWKLVVED